MDDARITAAGDGDHATGNPQNELLATAEGVLAWLHDRRAHMPEEMIDGREARHRKRLLVAIRRARGTVA